MTGFGAAAYHSVDPPAACESSEADFLEPHMPSHARPSAFTLIELLVVITIVAVLLAMLTPAIDRAMSQAEMVMCATRKHQMMLGTGMYLLDNKQYFFTAPSPWGAPNNAAGSAASNAGLAVVRKRLRSGLQRRAEWGLV